MAGLWWTTVTLVFLLSVGSLAAVDQNKLAELIQGIKKEYQISGMFSLAVSIQSEGKGDLDNIFQENLNESVQKELLKGDVYKGKRLTVAKVKHPQHAEWRVLNDLNLDANDLLVIFSYASSCDEHCTKIGGNYNIIEPIKNLISSKKWNKYAFVFEKVFTPGGSKIDDEGKLKQALKDLAKSGITLENIFRCFKPVNSKFQCTSCSSGGDVTKQCVDYNA